jgi:hypothetical protein
MEKSTRLKILQEIFDCFQSMAQWITINPGSYAKYHMKAESLIEFLEVEDCGSVGGFDKSNPHAVKNIWNVNSVFPRVTGYELYDRFLFVLSKYEQQNNIKPVCNFTAGSLGALFRKLSHIRNEYSG